MGLAIDWFNQIVQVTSPDTSVSGQVLHDFIEDQMASPRGSSELAIIQPEGKIEDPTNPGIYSQIILVFNSPWQVQFWSGSGYTRIFGAKLVGGLNDQPIKATGAAGDITVLESPVDGVTVATSTPGATAIEVRQEIDANSVELAAIKGKTDTIPVSPASVGDIPTEAELVAALPSVIEIRTEIDTNSTKLTAIKGKTDTIPVNPTDVSDIPTAAENADEILNRNIP